MSRMPKAQPFSFRPSVSLDARLSALAKQSHRTKASVLESLADEGERSRRYPGVAFRGPDSNRRAWMIGAGLDVWQIARALEDFGGDPTRMAQETDLNIRHILLAHAYHQEFPAEIDLAIEADRRHIDQLQREYPFVQSLVIED